MNGNKQQPEVTQKAPYAVDLEPGKYLWCACGKSLKQPFCDGSHTGTRFTPITFNVRQGDGKLWLCGCKQSKDAPLCDGRHNKL